MNVLRVRVPTVLGIVLVMLSSGLALCPTPARAQRVGACSSGFVSLTFDDGPAGPTSRLVRILRAAHVPATFFMVGQRVAARPRVARRVERAGFLIGNHSWAHVQMTTQTSAQVAATLRATDAALRRAGVHPTGLMRPPYGSLDSAARRGIRVAGLVPVLWTVDSRDWESGTARQVAARILSGLRPDATNIVLQHDGVARSPVSVDAVPLMIRGARRRGYCFVALDEHGRPGFPTPRVSVSVTDAREGDPAITTVRLSKPPGRATSVRLRTRSRTATVGKDVERFARRVEIPAGDLAVRVRLPVRRDGTDEPLEKFEVAIDRPRGLRIDDGSAVARVRDVDPPPRIDGVDAAVTEPVDAPTTVDVRLRLSHVSGKPIPVVVATQPGTADGGDFTGTRLRTVVRPGQRSFVVPVEVLADAVDEADETFTVAVVRGRHVRIGGAATVTVAAPPPPPPPARARPGLRRGDPAPG